MKQFNASHLEIKKWFAGHLETHPYEAGWADEAIFFIMIEHAEGERPTITAHVEISHDGVNWASDGTTPVSFTGIGLHPVKVAPNFGNWLRLVADIDGGKLFLNIQIHCKG
ncbi:hypothetical protein [uncultured Muribaculum sp.]|uniref:hypothetical protein n=1 Tax=uncultured Muribaculum sp. TaxID=1918613 RepID=UPI0025D9B861|nr:hypothetical protein [uncultured Muribaculum sp.]